MTAIAALAIGLLFATSIIGWCACYFFRESYRRVRSQRDVAQHNLHILRGAHIQACERIDYLNAQLAEQDDDGDWWKHGNN